MNFAAIADVLSSCDDPTSVRLSTGARFIRKLPVNASLAYLHKLYPALPPDRVPLLLREISVQDSGDFVAFLLGANGATLFGNTFHIFGFADCEDVSRSLELEAQRAISIVWKNELHRDVEPQAWSEGWRVIGSMSGWSTQLQIWLHLDGRCMLRSADGAARVHETFGACMADVLPRFASRFGCSGPFDETYGELEAVVRGSVQRN